MKVKICGITSIKDANLCYELGADAVGFIFYKKSKRYIQPEDAKEIIANLPVFIQKVGVFVNEAAETVNTIAEETGLTIVQLHGDESPEYVSQIKLPVIKTFRVDKNFDFETLSEYKNCSFLLDTFDSKELGGTGKTFDWDIIPNKLRDKIILAGGVSPENIKAIYEIIRPSAVDLSSSLEISPGVKDEAKLKKFFMNIKYIGEL